MQEKILLKDILFNEEKVRHLANLIQKVETNFNVQLFVIKVCEKFIELELKQRIIHISQTLYDFLPKEYEKAVKIILSSLPQELDPQKTDWDFWDFILAPLWEYIALFWCEKKYLTISFRALEEITKRFSVEFPIRTFLNKFEEETLEQMIIWSRSTNYHLRRLASEWSRTKLPWGQKIWLHYKKTETILDNLHWDKTRYVTRSVANHLNDISKIDALFVLEILKKWKKQWKQTDSELHFIIKHSLRNLIKEWNNWALELLWFQKAHISSMKINVQNPTIFIWEKLIFDLEIHSSQKQNLIIDYIIYFLNSKWNYSKKVHKIWKYLVQKNEVLKLSKAHLFNNFTTRKLYPWKHKIEIQVNGEVNKDFTFYIK